MTPKTHLKNLYIIDGLRTPIGTPFKSLKNFTAAQLASITIKEILRRSHMKRDLIGEVIIGNTVAAGTGQNLARQAAILSELSSSVPAFTINNVCGSGLQAVILAAQAIGCQEFECVIAGGAESATFCPYLAERKNKENIDETICIDSLICDGLTCNITDMHMGLLAEHIAKEFHIGRDRQDQFAYDSHIKACLAQRENKFINEIVSIKINGNEVFFEDERPRKNISLEKLKKLPCAFDAQGTVTAGNASAPCDGAACVILASDKLVKKENLVPKARILAYVSSAVEPKMAFASSISSVKACLEMCSLTVEDIDLFEICESFAAQSILVRDQLKISNEKLNIFGGDIALGHPLGTAGIRILVTLLHALIDQKKKRGVASVCLGGGGAVTLVVETV